MVSFRGGRLLFIITKGTARTPKSFVLEAHRARRQRVPRCSGRWGRLRKRPTDGVEAQDVATKHVGRDPAERTAGQRGGVMTTRLRCGNPAAGH